ncbi:hypothetical protein AVEN_44799-1 [Araneus ventricosus]|uniref:Uncharacterized protein n=1 Tax=Araneus ventricosus TaxID=182803 RepID=A0A4Y2K4E7_ARAVE|nr:hypothetical protein AVEN_44799-1 [Araneus ventricosus]
MLQSSLGVLILPTPSPARLTPNHTPPPSHGWISLFRDSANPTLISSVLLPRTFPHPPTGDLSLASKDHILLLWPNEMNGNPTTLEFQILPQSAPIITGISY